MFYNDVTHSGTFLTCIQDNITNKGTYLVRDFIQTNVEQLHRVHIYCFDKSIKRVKQLYGSSNFHHYYDYLSLIPSRNGQSKNSVEPDCVETYSFLSALNPGPSDFDRFVIVIDSLSSLLVYQDFPTMYKELHKVLYRKAISRTCNIQILAVIHEDTLEDRYLVLEHLKILAKTWVNVTSLFNVEISTKRTNGKLDIKKYQYELDDDRNIKNKIRRQTQVTNLEDIVEPISTFKLTLTEEEKQAKQNVKLPYVRDMNENNNLSEGGKIFYVPDEFDDWDDEDVDDDMDF